MVVKCIYSVHDLVPEGRAAIEINAGGPSGIPSRATITKDSNHSLEFTFGELMARVWEFSRFGALCPSRSDHS